MKIVFLGTFGMRPKGTMSARALPLARSLVQLGHSVTLIVPPWDFPSDAGREEESDGVRIIHLPVGPKALGVWYPLVTMRMWSACQRLHPDVVHCFKPKGFSGLTTMLLSLGRRLGKHQEMRLIVDSDDWEGAGGWNEVRNYDPMMKRVFAFQERHLLRSADAVTVASRALQQMAASLRGSAEQVYYVPNGLLDPKAATPPSDTVKRLSAALGLSGRPVVLLYTRFVEFHLSRLLDVMHNVFLRLPEAKFLVVGTGFNQEEQLLEVQVRARGLGDAVVQVGWIEAADLPNYFALADVAIYPCDATLINQTKCSMKLVELLNAGLPVVADAVGENTHYIEHGESGFLVQAENVPALVDSVVELLTNPDLRGRLGKAAQQRIRQHYRWEHLAQEVLRAYGEGNPEGEPKNIAPSVSSH